MINTFVYEKSLWDNGVTRVACCDEVGRGCLFGPVVAAAVILKPYEFIEGVRDSKKLSEKRREILYEIIMEQSSAVGIGIVSVEIIEQINIKNAARQAMKQAVENLVSNDGVTIMPEALLIDAEKLEMQYQQQAIVRGEDHVHGIAAASIIAKVTRDRMCYEWHEKFPEYGLDRNKGYGTKTHQDALRLHGPTPLHRKSFLSKLMRSLE